MRVPPENEDIRHFDREKETSKNESVEKETDKISGDFYQTLFDEIGSHTSIIYDLLTDHIHNHRAKEYGYRYDDAKSLIENGFDPFAEVDGNLFSYSDMEKDLSIDWGDVFVGSREKMPNVICWE